ncbi:thiolase family protein [Nocardia alni]|uniref:thiolase family protein n=1 Tax=Nocardia alni TaxID=2815723 RepID=UPI001C232708|nr:thiolase family protein [Nocardia alni]
MRDAVIVAAVRSPIGKRNGGLSPLHPVDLSATVLDALTERAGIDPALIDDVVWGCVGQVGEQGVNVARNAVLAAGWPESVPGTTVDRQCGSSQQAVHFAAAGVISGQYEIAVAGGIESMSRVPIGSSMGTNGQTPNSPRLLARYENVEPHQGVGAERMAERWNLSRERLDEYSLQSHERAAHAQDSGAFDAQITEIPVQDTVIRADEGIRRTTSLERLAGLRPAFTESGVITAGNSSQISDGSAALLVMTSERAAALGLTPLVRVHTAVVVGDDPMIMLSGPIPATAKALAKAGLTIDDIGTFEVNEAFASVPLAWIAETGAEEKVVNPDGGAIALGHPLGGSGARLMTTLIYRMSRGGIRYGLQTMCEGGGLANATILELL